MSETASVPPVNEQQFGREIAELRQRTMDLAECIGSHSKHNEAWLMKRWMKEGERNNRATLYCSFCGKSQHEVGKLIAGPAVFICNECVSVCQEIVSEPPPPQAEAERMAHEAVEASDD